MKQEVAIRELLVASENSSAPALRSIALTRNSQRATRNFPKAFSFIEVLFAVILLGIGFIMIAGIFPVAIQQSATTVNETAGQLICRDAIRMIQNAASVYGASTLFPVTNNTATPPVNVVLPFPYISGSPNLYQILGTDSYFTADRRYGWVGFYSRSSNTSPYAQVFVIALQNPNFPTYMVSGATSPAIVTTGNVPPPIPPSLYNAAPPTSATINANIFINPADGTSTIKLGNNPTPSNAAPGAFVLVAQDPGALPGFTPKRPVGTLNGRFFRLGAETDTDGSATQFLLQPGMDLNNSNNDKYEASANIPLLVFIIGRAPTLASSSANNYSYTGPFTGPNQDIAAMSAFIRVNTAGN